MAGKNSFINQVRIALIVAKSLLKKATETRELPQEVSDAVQEHLNSAFNLVKEYVNKDKD